MKIKQDPVSKLWCRSDGAVCMPPVGHTKFKKFRWTFGASDKYGYRQIRFRGKFYKVHQMVCRAFNGPAPEGKPFVDHINRVKDSNCSNNLRWVSYKENNDNKASVDRSTKRYGVRECENTRAYKKAYRDMHREKVRASDAIYRAKKRAQGLTRRKGPNGKVGWYPRIRTKPVV